MMTIEGLPATMAALAYQGCIAGRYTSDDTRFGGDEASFGARLFRRG